MNFIEQDWVILALGAIAGALVAISNLGKLIKEAVVYTYGFMKRRKMKNAKMEVILNSFECIQSKLDSLVSELRPNGGKSLRDLVEKINENTTYNREYVRATLDNDFQMIYETDSKGEYLWVNHTYGRYTGKQVEDLLGYGWLNSIATDHRSTVREEWESAIEEHRDFNLEYEIVGFQGERIKVLSVAKPIRISGTIKGYYGTVKVVQ